MNVMREWEEHGDCDGDGVRNKRNRWQQSWAQRVKIKRVTESDSVRERET